MTSPEVHATSPSSLDRFFAETGARRAPNNSFECESERMLRIEVDGDIWLKPGAAIAHRGTLHFERRHTLDAGSMTDAMLRETAPLGTGHRSRPALLRTSRITRSRCAALRRGHRRCMARTAGV